MVTAKKPAFGSDRWTHVAFTFQDVNSTKNKTSSATLYVNGKSHGSVKRPMKFTWSKPSGKSPGAVIMLGIGYVGYMDLSLIHI